MTAPFPHCGSPEGAPGRPPVGFRNRQIDEVYLLAGHTGGSRERESGGMVDALALGASGETRESSSLSFRTIYREVQ